MSKELTLNNALLRKVIDNMDKSQLQQISFKLPSHQIEIMDSIAQQTTLKYSKVYRMVIDLGLPLLAKQFNECFPDAKIDLDECDSKGPLNFGSDA